MFKVGQDVTVSGDLGVVVGPETKEHQENNPNNNSNTWVYLFKRGFASYFSNRNIKLNKNSIIK